MNCSNCGFENPDGMKFCGGCGSALQNLCPQCGFENPTRFKFCGECGTSLMGEMTTPIPTQEEPPTPVEPPPTNVPDAERRQLTVMFVDMVGSTSLSGELDPEDLREVVRSYQSACTDVITRYDGHVAQLLGDGLLVYFGFPSAHEDDAQRAVRSGLEIVNALGTLNTRLEQDQGIKLAVRLGIHTGLVVVGEMGGEGRQEQLAMGETPNIAARIQGLAEPDTLVISSDTFRLIQGYFDCVSLSEHDLRGVSQPLTVYQVRQESGVQDRFDITSGRGLTPLIGRESESTLLFERWEQAKDGQGQVILLSGEAGIGKSRLVQALKDHVAVGVPYTRLECRSSPYFTNSALYPIIDMVQRTLRFQADDTPEQNVAKLEQNLSQSRLPLEESVPLFASLLSLSLAEDRYPPLNLSPQRHRQKTLEAIVAIILELSEPQPVLFILEDLHWTDPTTLELLELLIDQTPTASLYTLLTCRPEYQPTWSHRSYLTEMTLNRLSRPQIEQIATQVANGKALPADIIEQLMDKTDGVPLYVEEITKSVLESGVLKELDGRYELSRPISSLSIPSTLQDSLMARLDRLDTAKAVAQYASVIGRQFSYDLLQAVSQLDEMTLQRELSRLVEAELVYQRGLPPQATYLFKHALVVDAAYASLLKSTRQNYHQRIAQTLEEGFSETAANQPELLAHHYTEAGLREQAVGYWHQASQRAFQNSGYPEALAHLTQGLSLIPTLPDTTERAQHELRMQITRGLVLTHTKGHISTEVGEVYTRARELCQQVGDIPQLSAILAGLRRFYQSRADYQNARDMGEQLLSLAQQQDEVAVLLWGHFGLGTPLYYLGELSAARAHLEQSIALYEPTEHRTLIARYGTDIGALSRSWVAMVLWHLGYPDQSLQRSHEARTLAQECSHPFTMYQNWVFTVMIHQFRHEAQPVLDAAEAILSLATEQLFPAYVPHATILRGWALSEQGHSEEGIGEMHHGLNACQLTSPQSYYLVLLAQAYGKTDQLEEGLHILAEALAHVQKTEERFYEAEIHRLKGQLLLTQSTDNQIEAESCFHQAITIAQDQSAKSWELRAATSLAKLRQSQGKRGEAHELLEPVYSWFTEGHDTADLVDAKALLDELS